MPYAAVSGELRLAPPEIPRFKFEPEPNSGNDSKVLVADDTDANFEIVEISLNRAGFTVTRAVNGRVAVAAARDADAILMDIEMPEMDGFEATRLIRQAELLDRRPPLPILALTAHALDGYRERCLAAGFTGFLTYSFRKESLVAAIQAALDDVKRSATQGVAGR